MPWLVDGCPALGEFATEGEALAAAWSQTMPGGKRPGVRERALDLSRPDTWEWRNNIAVAMTPVTTSMDTAAHGGRPVLKTTLRASRALAELVVHGVEGVEAQRKAYYKWIVRNVTPKFRAENPYGLKSDEDLSVSVATMFFEGATFIADVEAIIIPLPRMKVR